MSTLKNFGRSCIFYFSKYTISNQNEHENKSLSDSFVLFYDKPAQDLLPRRFQFSEPGVGSGHFSKINSKITYIHMQICIVDKGFS